MNLVIYTVNLVTCVSGLYLVEGAQVFQSIRPSPPSTNELPPVGTVFVADWLSQKLAGNHGGRRADVIIRDRGGGVHCLPCKGE